MCCWATQEEKRLLIVNISWLKESCGQQKRVVVPIYFWIIDSSQWLITKIKTYTWNIGVYTALSSAEQLFHMFFFSLFSAYISLLFIVMVTLKHYKDLYKKTTTLKSDKYRSHTKSESRSHPPEITAQLKSSVFTMHTQKNQKRFQPHRPNIHGELVICGAKAPLNILWFQASKFLWLMQCSFFFFFFLIDYNNKLQPK